MGQPITRHPAVAVPSHPSGLRALIALAAVVLALAAAAAVALVVDDDGAATPTRSAPPVPERVSDAVAVPAEPDATVTPAGVRFDGGPDEGTRGVGR